jgi:hypothetical protein
MSDMCPRCVGHQGTENLFLDDMGLDNSVELALANLDLIEQVLELVTFDDGDLLKGSSSTPTNAYLELDIEEDDDDGGESSGSVGDFDMEKDH